MQIWVVILIICKQDFPYGRTQVYWFSVHFTSPHTVTSFTPRTYPRGILIRAIWTNINQNSKRVCFPTCPAYSQGWPGLISYQCLATRARAKTSPVLGVDSFDKSQDTILPHCVMSIPPQIILYLHTYIAIVHISFLMWFGPLIASDSNCLYMSDHSSL